jgi:hypothetical protein
VLDKICRTITKDAEEIFQTNKFAALKQITQFEQSLSEIINRLFNKNLRAKKPPKIAIITAQNNRAA